MDTQYQLAKLLGKLNDVLDAFMSESKVNDDPPPLFPVRIVVSAGEGGDDDEPASFLYNVFALSVEDDGELGPLLGGDRTPWCERPNGAVHAARYGTAFRSALGTVYLFEAHEHRDTTTGADEQPEQEHFRCPRCGKGSGEEKVCAGCSKAITEEIARGD